MNLDRRFGPGAKAHGLETNQTGLPRTTLAVCHARPRHLEAHLLRLQAGALMLGQPSPWVNDIQTELLQWLQTVHPDGEAALRLLLLPAAGVITARLEALPAPPSPCRLVAMPHPLTEGRSDPAAPHKGLTGAWSVASMQEARRQGGDDALLLWPDGTIAETAIAAVGVEAHGILRLPPPEGRVASIAERLDLPAWAADRKVRIEQVPIPLASALEGQVWCMNALRGIWPAALL